MAKAVIATIGTDFRERVGKLTDRSSRLQAVHVGHLHVHEDEVERRRCHGGFDGLAPVSRDRHFVATLFEQTFRQPLVDRIVLGEQDAQTLRRSHRNVGDRACGAVTVSRGASLQGIVKRNSLPCP